MAPDIENPQAAEPKAKIFISYSRKDMSFADHLEAALKARGFEPLIDRTEIYAFEDWWKRIEALIGLADTVIFVLSPDAVASEVAMREVAYAAKLNKRFAPIVVRRVDAGAVPEALRRLNFIFFDDAHQFEASANALADALLTDIGWIRQHTEYGELAGRWLAAGQPNGLLLRSPALEVAEHWIVSRPRKAPEPTESIRAFVRASRHGARAARRLWRALLASMFVLLVGVIAGLIGWINQSYIEQKWRWYTTGLPFALAKIQPYVLKAPTEQALKAGDTFRECATGQGKSYCPEMIVIPAGSFIMGSPATEEGHSQLEEPQHKVTINDPFAVARFDLTFDEWDTCVAFGDCPEGISDSDFGHGKQPVINVNFDDAQRYVAWLSKVTGQPYRLLTESEYEYAARAGSETAYPWGDEIGQNNANCTGCGSRWDGIRVAPVGSFAPNRFGLYDMVGNAFEWLQDCAHSSYKGAPTDGSAWIEGGNCKSRMARGGSGGDPPYILRCAFRFAATIDHRSDYLGFRVARTLLTSLARRPETSIAQPKIAWAPRNQGELAKAPRP